MDLAEKSAIKKRFRVLDSNNDGVLSFNEMRELLSGGKRGMTRDEVRVLFKAVDKDESGTVDVDEFIDFLYKPPSCGSAPRNWFDSASSGDEETLSRLANQGIPIDAQDSEQSSEFPCCSGLTACMYASAAGNSKCLDLLVDLSCDVDAQDTTLGRTAAMFAAEEGRRECLLTLAECRANLNLKDVAGSSPMTLSATQGHLSCLQLLIKQRADIDAQDSKGWTSALHAARCGNERCLQALCRLRADMNKVNNDGETPVIVAVQAGDELCVRILCVHGVDLLAKTNLGETALMEATRLGNPLCLRLLQRHSRKAKTAGFLFVQRSEEEEETEVEGASELLDAVWYGQMDKLAELVDQVDVFRAKCADGWTPSMVAALNGHEACLEILIDKGVDLNEADADGFTAAMIAAIKGHANCIELLASHHADLDALSKDGSTAGILASRHGHEACIALLGRFSANLNAEDENGTTAAMHLLLKKEQIFHHEMGAADDVCDRLLEESPGSQTSSPGGSAYASWRSDTGTPASSPTSRSATASPHNADESVTGSWFRAAAQGFHKIMAQLIERRASVDAVDPSGMSAMMIAAEAGDHAIVKLLVKKQADANMRDKRFERTAMSYSAEGGHFACIRILIDDGDGIVDARDAAGSTPIMDAAYHGHAQCVRFLARRKAYLDMQDFSGFGPAQLAASQGHIECLKILADHGADLLTKNKDGSWSNVLHIVEQHFGLDTANSIVQGVDWNVLAAGGANSMADTLHSTRVSDTMLAASIHLNLWKLDHWGHQHIRDEELTKALFECLREFLHESGNRNLSPAGKETLSLLLNSGLIRAVRTELPPKYGAGLDRLNTEVLQELENALTERQEQLSRVAALTPEPDVYFTRTNRNDERVQGKLDQRDAMPSKLWRWLEELPEDCFQRLEITFRVFRMLDLVQTPTAFANYLRNNGMQSDHALYAKAAAHVLVGYAALVDNHFVKFMKELFGSHFKPAPVKKIPRIMAKMTGDVPLLADEALAADRADLRCAYFQLGDAVRGSVWAQGPTEMLNIVRKLRSLDTMTEYGRFDVWRIKNTHHERAEELTGGYRDVKVLGRFRAKQKKRGAFKLPISMIVEIQVIDSVYLDIKKYMHKAYAIDRGDFN